VMTKRDLERKSIMKILWITNIQLPAVRKKLGLPVEVVGGWMFSLANELSVSNQVSLAVCTTYSGNSLTKHSEDDIVYYLLPARKTKKYYDKSLEKYWLEVINEFNPDIIHVHGTEYAHGLACFKACPEQKYVISIQGLVSAVKEHFFAGIKPLELMKYTTLSDIKNGETIPQGLNSIKRRAEIEHQYLKLSSNIIGRTNWDYSHTKAINAKSDYYFCNEVLRPSFYESHKWSLETKENYTIFLSQANSPRKGLHQALKALSIVKEYYPVQLRIAGVDVTGGKKWVQRTITYGAYIRALVKKTGLNEKVVFLGRLNEKEMTEELRRAHVFICPSVIENSPNSLGEAQLIGTPCIASFVGGVPDMVKDGETGLLYRFDDYVMLAFKIIKLFANDDLAKHISKNGINAASERHHKATITSRTLEIYQTIKKK
jgi:glycosyltransferase involved in cell wall biosynthesis